MSDQANITGLSDSHCHLDFNAFDHDRDQILERARQAGVEHILDPGIDLESSRQAVLLADGYTEIYAAVGIHPNDMGGWQGEVTLQALRKLADGPKTAAIGEIGLDYYRDRTPRQQQIEVFRKQLELAQELSLPVVIHNRQSSEDMLSILREWTSGLAAAKSPLVGRAGVLHSFSAELATGQQAFELGLMLGIGGPVTFRNAPELQQTVAALPMESLLVETDAPFLAPHPHRGQRNEPAFVRLVVEKIAELHQLSFAEVAQITSANARRLFHW